MIFVQQNVSLQIEAIYKDLDLARTAAFESMVASNNLKGPLAEVRFQDMEKLLKNVNQRIQDLKREIETMKSSS